MSSGWSCPNEDRGRCRKVPGRDCDPGMKGCVLFGRFRFASPDKNRPANPRRNPGRRRAAAGGADRPD